jgi:hypothetical protein
MGRYFAECFLLLLTRVIFRISTSAYLYGGELHWDEWHEARILLRLLGEVLSFFVPLPTTNSYTLLPRVREFVVGK